MALVTTRSFEVCVVVRCCYHVNKPTSPAGSCVLMLGLQHAGMFWEDVGPSGGSRSLWGRECAVHLVCVLAPVLTEPLAS